MSEILRVALGSIVANPFRAVLTMLGVVIGVGSVITMLAWVMARSARSTSSLRRWART